jgi:hypothetical protein
MIATSGEPVYRERIAATAAMMRANEWSLSFVGVSGDATGCGGEAGGATVARDPPAGSRATVIP